jgi:hypothetical protein
MDSTRPILPAELEFFNKGTGKGNLSSGTTPINNTLGHSSFGGCIHQI